MKQSPQTQLQLRKGLMAQLEPWVMITVDAVITVITLGYKYSFHNSCICFYMNAKKIFVGLLYLLVT